MSEIALNVNGKTVAVKPGTTVAAAVMNAGEIAFRYAVSGEPRGPLCGMGICYECRVTIDGEMYARSCQIVCRSGMNVIT